MARAAHLRRSQLAALVAVPGHHPRRDPHVAAQGTARRRHRPRSPQPVGPRPRGAGDRGAVHRAVPRRRAARRRDGPGRRLDALESVELAFVAAVQTLPPRQRAVLLLRDVVALSAAEVAATLDTTVASVEQRAAAGPGDGGRPLARRQPAGGAARARRRGAAPARRRPDRGVGAPRHRRDRRRCWPPTPASRCRRCRRAFEGRDAVAEFFRVRMFADDWRLLPIGANGQLAVAGYMGDGPILPRGGIIVLTVRDGAIAALDSFVDPAGGDPVRHPGGRRAMSSRQCRVSARGRPRRRRPPPWPTPTPPPSSPIRWRSS